LFFLKSRNTSQRNRFKAAHMHGKRRRFMPLYVVYLPLNCGHGYQTLEGSRCRVIGRCLATSLRSLADLEDWCIANGSRPRYFTGQPVSQKHSLRGYP
jgi:hypothetical protein